MYWEMKYERTCVRNVTFGLSFRAKEPIPGCRNAAMALPNRFHGTGRFVDLGASNEIQFRVNTMLNHGGFPAFRFEFGPNPADLFV